MIELSTLVRRDHDELHYVLRVLGEPMSDDAQVVGMLERVRVGFAAHAEAETLALGAMLEHAQPPPAVYFLVSQVIASHLAQEAVLGQLVTLRPRTPAFCERASYLRQLIVHHAEHEAACMHPALREHVPREVFRTLAIAYETERRRRLGEQRRVG